MIKIFMIEVSNANHFEIRINGIFINSDIQHTLTKD